MKTTLLIALLTCTLCAKEVTVRVTVPDWVRYSTIAENGTVFLWENKPTLINTDVGLSFWYCDEGLNVTIYGGAVPKKNWKRSLRRVR